MPSEVARVRVIQSKYTRTAFEALLDCSPKYLVNHAMRTFFFGALIARQNQVTFDGEIFFLACALHDLGLTQKHAGPLPFEIQGAQAARKLLESDGFPTEKSQTVWDGIAMHPYPISGFKPPEISLVGAGAATDVVGGRVSSLPADDVRDVLRAFPRAGFKRRFVEDCSAIANKYPGAARNSFMRDIAERTNPAYHVSNICDAITSAPFDE
ncbi:MAG TPA: HD domain-containing protein [Bryobacteraceae bacterium]|nr:HD domain-containing protein [Bryobacteraceae bacterium]